MKRLFFAVAVTIFSAVAFVGCEILSRDFSDDDVLVVKQDGKVKYSDSDVRWRLVESPKGSGSYTLYMDGTRFVSMMPMLDMEVHKLVNQHPDPEHHFLFETKSIVPSIKGNPMPKYTLTNFRCEVEDWEVLRVSFTCKESDATYQKSI
jgi:hypothetical protein